MLLAWTKITLNPRTLFKDFARFKRHDEFWEIYELLREEFDENAGSYFLSIAEQIFRMVRFYIKNLR